MTATPSSVGSNQPVAITRGFLFADLRGYTAYVEARGDSAGAALLDVYRELMRETIAGYGGAEIKTEGDSFYVVFPSASTAMACGMAIVAAAAARTAADPERPIRVGVGIHAGESVAAGEGYVGSAVNIAARVCAQAGPGEVLVTETVRSLVRTSGQVAFTPRGRRRLKGIEEPVRVFRVDPAGAAVPKSATGAFRRGRRVLVALGGAGVALAAIVAVIAFGRIGVSPTPSPGTSGGGALASATPEIVERIVYSTVYAPPSGNAECNQFSESHLALVTPTGGEQTRLDRGGDVWETYGAWSPDGARIAFMGIDQRDQASLWIVGSDGSDPRNLVPVIPPELVDTSTDRIYRPSWSADGKQLLFTYGTGGVWVISAAGSGLHRLIAPLPAPAQPTPDPDGNVEEIPPPLLGASTWTPDGRIVVEVTVPSVDPKASEPATSLQVSAADGSGLAPLAGLPAGLSVTRPAWSGDGRLAFLANAAGSSDLAQPTDLYVFDPAGGDARKLPGTTGIADAPSWSPDGTKLAFANGVLYTIGADGTSLTKLGGAAGEAACWPSWGRTTTAALPQPTALPSAGATPSIQTYHRGRLEAGTYETSVFEPRTRFTVEDGWIGLNNYIDAIGLGHPGTPFGEIDVGRIQVVSETPCLGSPNRLIGPSARDFIAFLQAHPYLTTSDPQPVIVGGKRGLAIDVEVTRPLLPADCPDSPLPPDHPAWTHEYVFQVGQESVWLRYHDRVRIVSIDVVDGPAVTFIIESTPDDYQAFLPIAQRVVDSLAFP
jgi:class 3 adenylate cyclase